VAQSLFHFESGVQKKTTLATNTYAWWSGAVGAVTSL
jgi:hypothetical protein